MSTEAHPFKHIEIEINTACDLACFGCDRFSDVTNAPNMTVEQVALFVKESLDLKWEWERIRVLGGEPTLHPKFKEIVELLIEYRTHFPKVFLQVLTNGLGKSAQYKDWLASVGVNMHAEAKTKDVQPPWFNNTRIVPVDRDPAVGALEPCRMFGVRSCGIGLTRHGYFLDGAGASIARVAGHNIAVLHLADLTWDAMIEQSKVLCRICGHWNPRNGPKVVELVSKTGQVTGEYWANALAKYKQSKPVLPVYGE